jgi:cell division protein ZapD
MPYKHPLKSLGFCFGQWVRDNTFSNTGSVMVAETSYSDGIVFEHPLNERMRTLLRLEFLFAQGWYGVEGESPWHSRMAVNTLVDIVALLSRGDLRTEIQKELERTIASLEALEQREDVDPNRLSSVLSDCKRVAGQLRDATPGLPQNIRDNEFLNNISQRAGILGGSCGFDIPSYHRWLNRSAEHRRRDLEDWFAGFNNLNEATGLILELMRGSAEPSAQQASEGSFQAMLDRDVAYKMVRVTLPADTDWFPEISGSHHFCTIRFMSQPDPCQRPQQTTEDVSFRLECCAM